jgi:hypothetical protein
MIFRILHCFFVPMPIVGDLLDIFQWKQDLQQTAAYFTSPNRRHGALSHGSRRTRCAVARARLSNRALRLQRVHHIG